VFHLPSAFNSSAVLPRAPLLWQEGEVMVGGFVYCGLLGGDFLREGFFLFRNFLVPAGG
jgi:hypothetical protein